MRVLYLTLFLAVSDQITKILIKGIEIPFLNISIEGMRIGQSFDVIGSFLRITFVENPGMAFGIDVGESSKLFLSLFSVAASIGILIYLYRIRRDSLIIRIALAFILAGAIGNLIDRAFYGLIYDYAPIFYGSVVDFVNVDFFDFSLFGRTYDRFPIFNIADSCVTIGVVLLLAFNRHHEKKIESKEESAIIEETLAATGDPKMTEESSIEKKVDEGIDKEEVMLNGAGSEDGKDNNGKEVSV